MLNRGGVILTLLLLALVSGSVWGQEVTVEQSVFTELNSKSLGGDAKVSYATAKGGGTSNPAINNDEIRLYQNASGNGGGSITISVIDGFELVSAEIGSSMSTSIAYTINESVEKSKTESLNANATYAASNLNAKSVTFYCMGRDKKSRLYVNYLKVVYRPVEITQVAASVFAPANGTTFVDKLTVGASCPTEGATIYYTKDGAEPTTGSDKFPTEGVTLTETTTLKAIAVKDGLDNSEVVTATYTKLEPYASLKALKESGIATTEGVTCFVELKDAVVTYADSRKAYIQDVTGGLYIYGNNDLKAGTKLNGVVSAQLALYNGLYELKVEGGEFDNVEVAEGVEIPVQEVTVAELNQNFARYESMRVKVVDATVTSGFNNKNGEIEQNGEKIALRAADESITADVQATVDVTGYPGLFHSDKQLNVILQEDIAVKTAGKTQATLAFEQGAYSVNLGESLIIKATTNSTSPIIYSSEDEEIAKVDSEGKVQAGNKAGTVTITASVAENDEFTGATATCTVNVVDPSALPEARALVAEKDGVYYAMLSSNKISDKKLDTDVVDVLNNKVVKTSETVDF